MGLRFLKDGNIYCQWGVSTTDAKCYDGKTGDVVARPFRIRRDSAADEAGVPAAYHKLPHV